MAWWGLCIFLMHMELKIDEIEVAPDSASAHAESTESCEEMFFLP